MKILANLFFFGFTYALQIERQTEKTGAMFEYIKIGMIVFMISFLVLCAFLLFFKQIRDYCRNPVDLEAFLGISLAKINNVDAASKKDRVEMGVGSNPQNIKDWIEDIWESYDIDGNGLIDKLEIKTFVAQTLKTAGI